MDVQIKWIENMEFVAETGSGHALIVDGPPSIGGENLGPRPMELMLCGVGTCTAVDTVFILKKARQDVSDIRIKITAERAETDPKVFTKIHLHFIIEGRKLNHKQVGRAVDLSAEKYCSASLMLRATVNITHDYVINDIA